MGISEIHGQYGVRLYTDDMGAEAIIGGITDSAVHLGTKVGGEASSGEYYRRHVAVYGLDPAASFVSMAIAKCMGSSSGQAGLGILGRAINATANAGLQMYLQKHARGSTRTAGSAHRKYTMSQGILVPHRLTCEQGGNASITYGGVITWDGSNNPVLIADAEALPAGLVDNERFTLGPIQIGNGSRQITLDAYDSLVIEFNVLVRTKSAEGALYPGFVSIGFGDPRVTMRGVNAKWLDNELGSLTQVPMLGQALTHANTIFYLKKRAVGATFVPNGTAEHIKFSVDGIAVVDPAFEASQDEDAVTTLTLDTRYDGSNAPLAVTVDSTIT